MESGTCQELFKLCSLDVSSNASHHTFSPHKYCNHFVTVTLKKPQTKPNKNKTSKSPEIRNRKGKAPISKAFPFIQNSPWKRLIILGVVPDYLTADHVDNVLGNIGGMVRYPLQMP